MIKKILSFICATCIIIPCVFMFSACKNDDNNNEDAGGSTVVYTVNESEWETNFKITKVREQSQTVACLTVINGESSLADITSYTLSATGNIIEGDETTPGSGVLKVAPNGLDMEFYINSVQQAEQTKKVPSTDSQYIGLTATLTSFFAFSGKYNDFTFDTNKNAYVAENLTVSVVNEDDISTTMNLYNKKVEVTFVNGYLNTISTELCDETFEEETIFQTFVFTFSNINNTTVTID